MAPSNSMTAHSGCSAPTLEICIGDTHVADLYDLSEDPTSKSLGWRLVYAQEWLNSPMPFPLSPNLPLGAQSTGVGVKTFFENYLPEGEAFEDLIQQTQIHRDNVLGLALVLRNDLPGAVTLRLPGHAGDVSNDVVPRPNVFRPIENREILQRLAVPEQIPMNYWDKRYRLSVAGVQTKPEPPAPNS